MTARTDFVELGRRLRNVTAVLAALAVVGAAVEALVRGAGADVVVRWGTGFGSSVVLVAVALTAVQASRTATAAQRRGERLASDDVGLVPPRRRGAIFGDRE